MSLLNQRQKKLLSILIESNQWFKGNELSAQLMVSVRTISNDIRMMNQQFETALISSSHQGYQLSNPTLAKRFLAKQEQPSYIPQSQNERIFYFLRKILAHNQLNLLDLAEEIYVSLSTIDKDLKEIQTILSKKSNIRISKKGYQLHIDGLEKEKRALVSELLFQETKNSFFNFQKYQIYFPHYSLETICELVLSATSRHDLFINDLSLVNLVVHIAITLDRIRNENFIEESDLTTESVATEYRCAQEIAQELTKQFLIRIPDKEIVYLAYLIMGKKFSSVSEQQFESLTQIVDNKYIQLMHLLLTKLEDELGIPLYDHELELNLALHTANAIKRIRNDHFAKNPLLGDLKLNYPFIFEIAVFITNELTKHTGYIFNEDEIGYFALHIGSTYEKRQQQNRRTLQVAVIHSKYFKKISDFIRKIEDLYHISIDMIHVFSLYDQNKLTDLNVDFILSTLPIDLDTQIPIIQISPFFSQADLSKIEDFIVELNKQTQLHLLKKYIDKYFHQSLFFKNIHVRDRFQLIQQMGERMAREKFVPASFVESLIQREKLSATSFSSRFAIPHSIEMSAYETVIGTALLQKPIKWGDYQVSVVIMVAIKEEQRKDFMLLYENLIPILTDHKKITELTQATDFSNFKQILLKEYVPPAVR